MRRLKRQTKRVVIRPIPAEDYAAWKKTQLQMKPAMNRWDHDPKPVAELTRAKFNAWIKVKKDRMKAGKSYEFGIFNADGEFVGLVAVLDVARGISQSAYLGYRMHNCHWGQGYAKEAGGLSARGVG